MAADKQHAHELIDRLAPGQIAAVVGPLEIILDPFARTLANAPYDDEPVSPQEARELDEARASLARGEGIPHEQQPVPCERHVGSKNQNKHDQNRHGLSPNEESL
jgi:hypothetical protein